jgi:hypothetical protein
MMKFMYVSFMNCQNYKIDLFVVIPLFNCLFCELLVSQTV